jgi:DNA-binding transcriptional regulator LsrR (DeoR family)
MQNNDPRNIYLAQVALLYYDHGRSQQEIAEEFGISRSAVSRLLTEAREKGIVEIIVHYPWRTSPELGQQLMSTFRLKAASVLVTGNKTYQEMLQGLGVLAARYLESILYDGVAIGISWGTALYQMIRAMRQRRLSGVEVVQLIGASGSENVPTDGPILAQLLAEQLGAACYYLHAPLIVENEAVREILVQDRNIRETLARAERADVALVGIGTTRSDLSSLVRAGYVDTAEEERIRGTGAVGDICGQHFSLSGEWLDIDINRRVVGVTLDTLSRIDMVIGVAGNSRKGPAILGALRGGYLNVLITDDQAAQRVLALHQATASNSASPSDLEDSLQASPNPWRT